MKAHELAEKFAEGWQTVPVEQFARAEQEATGLRDKLEAHGVNLTNDEVLVALGGLVAVIDEHIQAHYNLGCCPPETMIGNECWRVLGALTMMLAARRDRGAA